MAVGLIDKLTNFLMPVEETETVMTEVPVAREKKTHLKLQPVSSSLKVFVGTPGSFDDVKVLADYLRAGTSVVVNYEHVDEAIQQRIHDFLTGLCYVIGGLAERISENVLIYTPANVDVSKELYSFAVPTYVKKKE
ncbi:Hypothetical protein LUCI_4010 [Lucifera butyrica]|uniref:Cell division protein SepF n=1 Tax=Lucifera butyrica TaxID=1351585 RepID=A0A498RF55_9FIRM|nr:cell division protein SepF [Lucifera butyrica]VBB08732.1 Hypothetical protein LUCI_4010 [Lucifera butyrica]